MSIQPTAPTPSNNHPLAQENQPHPLTSIAWETLRAQDRTSTPLTSTPSQPDMLTNISNLFWKTVTHVFPRQMERHELAKGLRQWENNPNVQGDKKEAVFRILEAYDSNSTTLSLYALQLTSIPSEIGNFSTLASLCLSNNLLKQLPPEISNLSPLTSLNLMNNRFQQFPPEIGHLTELKELHLTHNQLRQLPPEIRNLSALTALDLSWNQLQQLPPEIGNLSALTTLNLNNNQFQLLPPEIGNLSALTALDLSYNRLQQLPPEIGRIIHLKFLNITNNPNLREPPITLGEIPELTDLDIKRTAIPQTVVDSLLTSCRSKRDQAASRRLPNRVELWQGFARKNYTLDFIHKLTDQEKITINEWLVRLSKTRDFASNQTDLAKTACSILQDLNTHEEFKTAFFNQVTANLEECEDRAAMALNELFVSWKILTMDQSASLKDKLILLKGTARTEALRKALASKIGDQGESVEIYLYYESSMQETLNLLTAIKKMHHSDIGKRNWINKQELSISVENTYLEIMASYPQLEALAKQDLSQELKKIEKEIRTKEANVETLSGKVHLDACNNLKLEYEKSIRELQISWIKEKLGIK